MGRECRRAQATGSNNIRQRWALCSGSRETPGADVSLYLVAKGGEATVNQGSGDNPAIALLTVLGNTPPAKVVINEMTTVASVWTNAQFLDGTALKGHALGLRIAAGNVPNFVDLETGGYGGMIQDGFNSTQTPTMANFATLSSVLAGCTTRVKADACHSLFAAATGRDGKAPTDTLTAALSIAHNTGFKPERVFALLDAFYPVPQGKHLRATPFMPYLSFAPGAWVLPLKFSGGGNAGGAKIMFDSEGNAWSGDNFLVGWQGHDDLWPGNLSKFAPNGRPLSPMTTRVHRRRPARSRVRHSDRCERPRVGDKHQWPDNLAVRQDRQAAFAA